MASLFFKKTVNFGKDLEELEARLHNGDGKDYRLTETAPLHYRFKAINNEEVSFPTDISRVFRILYFITVLHARIEENPDSHIRIHFHTKLNLWGLAIIVVLWLFWGVMAPGGLNLFAIIVVPIGVQALIRFSEKALFEQIIYRLRLASNPHQTRRTR